MGVAGESSDDGSPYLMGTFVQTEYSEPILNAKPFRLLLCPIIVRTRIIRSLKISFPSCDLKTCR